MENICEWKNCSEVGKFKAPIERDNSKNFKWLCEEHIKQFNKSWNYFEGMSQLEIENFIKSDLTWHRPTQKFSSSDNFFSILWNNALSDKFNIFQDEKSVNILKTRKFIEKDNSRSYQWLCEEHIKSFNKNWNYFEGMSQKQIENFVKSDLTWHRPTQKFGSSDNFFNILWNNALSDKFNPFNEEKILNNLKSVKM